MQYEPLRKKVRFNQCITEHPCFNDARLVLSCLGDKNFRDWVLSLTEQYKSDVCDKPVDGLDYNSLSYSDAMCLMGRCLKELVSKEMTIPQERVNSGAKVVLDAKSNHEVVLLLVKMLSSLVQIQQMERAITKLDLTKSLKDNDFNFNSKEPVPRVAQKTNMKYK